MKTLFILMIYTRKNIFQFRYIIQNEVGLREL